MGWKQTDEFAYKLVDFKRSFNHIQLELDMYV